MFFCEKCRYIFNVTKEVKSKQTGGKVDSALNTIFEKFKNGEKFVEKDFKKINGKDVTDDERYEIMSKKNQKKMLSMIKSVDPEILVEDNSEEPVVGSNVAYFICKFCKNHKPIKPGTFIYSKNYSTTTVETEDYTYAIYDQTLARTRNYICPNSECPTHKDNSGKEAVITKNSTEQVVYVCTVCSTDWINAI
jgi:hypothetical protein